MSHVIVTISRQLGSGGAFIGQEVARRLGIKYLDREILREASRILREDEVVLAEREERVSSFLESAFSILAAGSPETGYIPPPIRLIYDQELFSVEADIIRRVAERESAVIVGRGGFHILRGHPDLVNIFFHAPKEFRIKRVMDIYNISDISEARDTIEESDSNRRKFIETMTGEIWTNALSYHLCIDTGVAVFFNAVEMILRFVERLGKREIP